VVVERERDCTATIPNQATYVSKHTATPTHRAINRFLSLLPSTPSFNQYCSIQSLPIGKDFSLANIQLLSAHLVDNHKDLLNKLASDPSADYQKQLAEAIYNSRPRDVPNDGKYLDRFKSAFLNANGERWALESGDKKLIELYNALSQNIKLTANLRNRKQDMMRNMGFRRNRDTSTLSNIPVIELQHSCLECEGEIRVSPPKQLLCPL
jgi:hypothetical protein